MYNEHSKKLCWCGGHNWKNVKKNKHHHSTKMKLKYRSGRLFKLKIQNKETLDIGMLVGYV